MMAWTRGVSKGWPLSGRPWAMYAYIRCKGVSQIGVDLLARDRLSPFLVFFVAAEGGAFVL